MNVRPIAGAAGVTGDVPAGLDDTADGDDARFDNLGDLFLDSSRTLLWFLDRDNLALRTLDLTTNTVATIARFPNPLGGDPPQIVEARHLWVDDDHLVVAGVEQRSGTWTEWLAFVDRVTGAVTDLVTHPDAAHGHLARIPNPDGTWTDAFWVKVYDGGARWRKLELSGGTWTWGTETGADPTDEAVVPGPGGPDGGWTVWRFVGYVYPSNVGFNNFDGASAGALDTARPGQLALSPFGFPPDGVTILGTPISGQTDLAHWSFAANEWIPYTGGQWQFPLGFDARNFVGIATDPLSRLLFFTSATQVWMTEHAGGGWQTRTILR